MRTVVAKFGGSSLADAAHFRRIREIVEADPDRRFIVVSAPGKRFPEDTKVTDLLLACYEEAVTGKSFAAELSRVKTRYQEIIDGLQLDFPLDREIGILSRHLSGKPDPEYVASRGEYLNARIMADYLGFTFVDPEWCVCFDGDGKLNDAMTRRAVSASLRPLERAVIAGFYGADNDGRIRTFSRGGSDVTGSLAACALHADLYENWTDVSGLMSADPRIVNDPKSVEYISYRELRTLSYMGASVLHTDSVLPVSDMGIPINIRNTEHPEHPGTMIVRKLPKGQKKDPVVGVAGRKGMTVIQAEKVMASDGSGFAAIILDLLRKRQLPFEQCLTGIDTVTLVIRSDLLEKYKEGLLEEMRTTLHPDFISIKENLSMIAVVGEKGTEASNANVQVLHALTKAGIEISTINQGTGKLNLLIGIPEDKYDTAIRAIYETMG